MCGGLMFLLFFFFKQKTAYEMRISDWSSDVCSSESERFEDIQRIIQLNPEIPLALVVERDGETLQKTVTPTIHEQTDRFGNVHRFGRLGIARGGLEVVRLGPIESVGAAIEKTVVMSGTDRKSTRRESRQ